MATPIRVVDLRQSEYVEITSDKFVERLLIQLGELEKERDSILNDLSKLLVELDQGLVVLADWLGGKEVRGKYATAHILFERLKHNQLCSNKLYMYAGNYGGVPITLICLTLEQAREFGL